LRLLDPPQLARLVVGGLPRWGQKRMVGRQRDSCMSSVWSGRLVKLPLTSFGSRAVGRLAEGKRASFRGPPANAANQSGRGCCPAMPKPARSCPRVKPLPSRPWRPSYLNSSTRSERRFASTSSRRRHSLRSRRSLPTKSRRSRRSRRSLYGSHRSLYGSYRTLCRSRRDRQVVSRAGGFPCRRHKTSPG
jgi:hypothetical protein